MTKLGGYTLQLGGPAETAPTLSFLPPGPTVIGAAMRIETISLSSHNPKVGTLAVVESTIINQGIFKALTHQGGSATLNIILDRPGMINQGTIKAVGDGATVRVSRTPNNPFGFLQNDNQIIANGGNVYIEPDVTGSGNILVENGGRLDIGDSVSSGNIIRITSGTLAFEPTNPAGQGFQDNPRMTFGGLLDLDGDARIIVAGVWDKDEPHSVGLMPLGDGLGDGGFQLQAFAGTKLVFRANLDKDDVHHVGQFIPERIGNDMLIRYDH